MKLEAASPSGERLPGNFIAPVLSAFWPHPGTDPARFLVLLILTLYLPVRSALVGLKSKQSRRQIAAERRFCTDGLCFFSLASSIINRNTPLTNYLMTIR